MISQLQFHYGSARVGDVRIVEQEGGHSARRRPTLEIDGRPATPTRRFWTSFFVRFGISENVFNYFTPAEVFERIAAKAKDDHLRYCLEENAKGELKLLAVSSRNRPALPYSRVVDIAGRYGAEEYLYHEGVVTTTHTPRSGNRTFDIQGDEFQHRFVMDTPIDGYGNPKIHLSFLRLLCENGMVGYSKVFRSELPIGKDGEYSLLRALDSFDNDEGYSALRQRFESAQRSWASLHECETLYKVLAKLQAAGQFAPETQPIRRFQEVTGNLLELYSVGTLQALSVKRRRVLPARCRMYDLINFASELATHHAGPQAHHMLQAVIGDYISDEFDLEGTADKMREFNDFFLPEMN